MKELLEQLEQANTNLRRAYVAFEVARENYEKALAFYAGKLPEFQEPCQVPKQ